MYFSTLPGATRTVTTDGLSFSATPVMIMFVLVAETFSVVTVINSSYPVALAESSYSPTPKTSADTTFCPLPASSP